MFSDAALIRRAGLRPEAVRTLWRSFLAGHRGLYWSRVWSIYVLLSWFGPGMNNPAGSILWSINEPLLRPVRRVLPPQAGLDFSPLVVILLLQVAGIVLSST